MNAVNLYHAANIQNFCNTQNFNSENMDIYERILTKEEINKRFITAVTAIMTNKLVSSKAGLAESLGVKPAKFSEILNGRMNVGIDMIAKMCDFYEVSPDWLLLSRGNNVFRQITKPTIWVDDENLNMEYMEGKMPDNKNPENTMVGDIPNVVPTSASSDAVTLRLMDMVSEKDRVIKEKETKIDHLQSELRQQSAELAALKAKYQDKESDFKFPNIIEDFTDKLSGDYGEDYSPTKPHTTSKRSSAGKM